MEKINKNWEYGNSIASAVVAAMTLSSVPSFSTKCPFHVFVAGGVASAAVILSMWMIGRRGKSIRRYDVDHRFTDVASYNGLVFTSGQVGEGDTIEKQTISALKCVDDALKKAGSDKSKILECTIWLSNMQYYDGMVCFDILMFSPAIF